MGAFPCSGSAAALARCLSLADCTVRPDGLAGWLAAKVGKAAAVFSAACASDTIPTTCSSPSWGRGAQLAVWRLVPSDEIFYRSNAAAHRSAACHAFRL